MFSILHAHTMFSLHDSTQTPEELVKRTKELGYHSVTLTDHGTLLGIDDFMEAGETYGINTVPGIEFYLENKDHFLVVAKDIEGFRSISYALRDSNEHIISSGKNDFPITTREIIQKYFSGNEHVIATTACIGGPISKILLTNMRTNKKIQKLQDQLAEAEKPYSEFKNAKKLYTDAADEVKRIKKEITALKKYTTKTFLNQIEKVRKTLNSNPDDVQINEKLSDLMSMKRLAETNLPILTEQEKEATEKRILFKQKSDKLKNKANKYTKLKEKIKSFEFIEESKLYEEAKNELQKYKEIFSNLYIELQYHHVEEEKYVMPLLVRLGKELNLPFIAANDAHMTGNGENDIEARQIVRYGYFENHQSLSDEDKELYVKSENALREILEEILDPDTVTEAIDNTDVINQCNVVFTKEPHYPKCEDSQLFYKIIEKRKQEFIKNGNWDQEHEERLQREMVIIPQMGYVDYHMIVYDYCNMMRKLGKIPKNELKNMPRDFSKIAQWLEQKNFRSGIGVGPGRGSAAGSLVCYLLGITNLDPVKYNLLFDRYLNPERVTLPDIDTDVKTSLRPYIIRYLKWKYGEKAVCSIMTKTTYGAKEAIQTAGRDRASELYQHLPKKEKDKMTRQYLYDNTLPVSDLIPVEPKATLAKNENTFLSTFGHDKEKVLLWNHAKLIEGKLSATGVHAGGVVISDNDNINDYVPLSWRAEKQVWAAQCDMIQIEQKGLLKMDLLGLSNLDIISDCVQLVERNQGIVIDLDNIPFEEEVFEKIFSAGLTNSVFQFESAGMKKMLMEFKPSCFEDLILLVAAYRPGPMKYLPDIIKVKHKHMPLEYKTPELEPILSTTYGATVYQEQVMQIFKELAGYSLGDADLVRRAMSKKKEEKLKIEKKAFVYGDPDRNIVGCIQNGIREDIALSIFDDMIDFAKYAFNKSHAAAYSVLSYQTAWLKYHFPKEFLCAMFNNKDQDKYKPIVEDCKTFHIPILPASINKSYKQFTIEDDSIRYGFYGIKGIGEKTEIIQNIIQNRSQKRKYEPYTSVSDFMIRNMDTEKIKLPDTKTVEKLVNVGAFDEFHIERRELNERIEEKETTKFNSIFHLTNEIKETFDQPYLQEKDLTYNINSELSLLGMFLSEHPLKKYEAPEKYGCIEFNSETLGNICVMGMLTDLKKGVNQKSGKPYMILTITNESDSLNIGLFGQKYDLYGKMAEELLNNVIKIWCDKKDSRTYYCNKIAHLNATTETYYVSLDSIEKTAFATTVMNERNKEDKKNRLIVQFLFNGKGLEIDPICRKFYVSDEVVRKLGAIRLNQSGF